MLTKLGEKLFDCLGEKNYGIKQSYFEELFRELTKFYRIADLFPYEHYNDQFKLFFNNDSIGFVLETPPLVGASEEMQKEISGLFQHVLPESSSLQVMLFADPHIGSQLNNWQQTRANSDLENLAKKRTEHLNQFGFKSPNQPYSLRNFRCFISFSQNSVNNNEVVLTGVNQIKQQIVTTLEMLGLPVLV